MSFGKAGHFDGSVVTRPIHRRRQPASLSCPLETFRRWRPGIRRMLDLGSSDDAALSAAGQGSVFDSTYSLFRMVADLYKTFLCGGRKPGRHLTIAESHSRWSAK
jgi:hypothetical protein